MILARYLCNFLHQSDIKISMIYTVRKYLYVSKLNIGNMVEKDLKYPRGYQELQYRLRDKPSMLAVEGVCNNCTYTIQALRK